MAILFDQASGQQVLNGPGTIVWPHPNVLTPVAVVVNLTWSSDAAGGGDSFVSSVTYGGVAMTFLGFVQAGDCFLEKWVLKEPPDGTQFVEVVMGGTDTSLGTANSTTYYSDGNGYATFGSLDTQQDSTSPITNPVTGTGAGNILDHGYLVYDGGSAAVTVTPNGTAETLRSGFLTQGGTASYTRRQSGTTSQTSAVGTVTASATLSADRSSAIASVEIQEVRRPGFFF